VLERQRGHCVSRAKNPVATETMLRACAGLITLEGDMIDVPQKMARLERDHRGYPIPFIVLRTSDGKAHFTVNDDARVAVAAKHQVCGTLLGEALTMIGVVPAPVPDMAFRDPSVDNGGHLEGARTAQ